MNVIAHPVSTRGKIAATIRELGPLGFLRLAMLACVALVLSPLMAIELGLCESGRSRRITVARWMHRLAWCACKIVGIQVHVIGDRPMIEANLHHRGVGLASRLALAAASPNITSESAVAVPVALEFCETLTKTLDLDEPNTPSEAAAILNGPGGEIVVMFGFPVRRASSGELSDRSNALADIGGFLRHYA